MTEAPALDRVRQAEDEARPKAYPERQGSLGAWLLQRRRLRRERFLLRAKAFSLRKEAARNLFISGCLLFDVLVVPEPALILGGVVGLALSGVLLVAALALEIDFYRSHFALPPPEQGA